MEKTQAINIQYDRKGFEDNELIEIFKAILKPRLIEERMLILLRQGKITKWFSGWGQEGIAVGIAHCMEDDEFILPMHRNLGVFTSRNVPLHRLFSQFQGKMDGFTKGRDRSFHFGTIEHHIVGMISHLGPQMAVADGIALSHKLKNEPKATIVFSGEGGTSEGDVHEAMNVAAVWDLPVVFAIENNQWGLSTPISEQFRCESIADRAVGYGIEGLKVDGNNVLEVVRTMKNVTEKMRKNPKPVLIEFHTYRIRGHEEASGTKYYPAGMIEEWEKFDPVTNFQNYLLKEGIITEEFIQQLTDEYHKEIMDAWHQTADEPAVEPNTEQELADVFAPYIQQVIEASGKKTEKRFIDAISDGLRQGMERHENSVIMGQDIAEYGGVFKITDGFVEKFGKERVRNTPICESAIVGAGMGLSIGKMKAIVEMQFADFSTMGFNQIVNNLAKLHWRWGENADVVVRMPTGAGTGAGPYHSQSNEAWFFHTPGLKIVYPAFPSDAKGLLTAAIEDPNPVLYFEHKYLYRSLREEIYDDYYTTEIGKAKVVKEGNGISIITYGMGVHWALEVADKHPEMELEIIDLRTLVPMDTETIFASVRKNGKVLVLQEANEIGGVAAEIVAQINENCFESLDAPIARVASLNTPIPFSKALEANFLANNRLEETLIKLNEY